MPDNGRMAALRAKAEGMGLDCQIERNDKEGEAVKKRQTFRCPRCGKMTMTYAPRRYWSGKKMGVRGWCPCGYRGGKR